MKLPSLIKATLIKRYKRFLADVRLPSGEVLTVHCPNTGAMTGCAPAGANVWLSTSDNPKRKYQHTWELVETLPGDWICIHSAKANAVVKEAIENTLAGDVVIKELVGYDTLRSEVKCGTEKSRIDFVLEKTNEFGLSEQCFIEVKSVTLQLSEVTELADDAEEGKGIFPDAVSERGRKHLRELIEMKKQGHRAILFFCVFHSGINSVAPADSIDSQYGDVFREALACGVEVLAYRAAISAQEIILKDALPVFDRQ
jgi:sugar fermentation stimulation protein A